VSYTNLDDSTVGILDDYKNKVPLMRDGSDISVFIVNSI
jgi:hypothetical protein